MLNEIDFRICPKCGGKFENKENNLLVCIKCRLHFYISPRPCNGAIVENQKNEILLVKRKFLPKKNFWDLPGGFIDIGETAEQSIVREIKEELGVDLKQVKYLESFYDRYLYSGINYHTLGLIYQGKVTIGKLKINDDIRAIKFFPKNKIPYKKIAFESVRQALKNYLIIQ